MQHTVEEITLSTATKGLFIDVPGSAVINFGLYFNAGYQFADRTKYEVPHLIEHHILNATKSYPRFGQIQTEMGRNGARTNAGTGTDFISYVATAPADDALRVLSLTGKVLTEPLFPAAQYVTERENVRSELGNKTSNYGLMAAMLLHEQTNPREVMEYRTRIAQLDAISHDDVVGHYTKTHTARNAQFIVAGSVGPLRKQLIAALETIYGSLPQGSRLELATDIGLRVERPVTWERETDAVHFLVDWYATGGEPAENAAQKLMHLLLSDGKESRIFGAARDQGLSYHVHSGGHVSLHETMASVSGHAVPGKLLPLFELVGRETRRIASEPVGDDELAAAKTRFKGQAAIIMQTAAAVANWYASRHLHDGTIMPHARFHELIDQVTPADIQAVAHKLFTSPRRGLAGVGPTAQTGINDWVAALILAG